MDKKDKKKVWKEEQKRNARSAFPLPETELTKLFNFVGSELEKHGCDHTHTLTSIWINNEGLSSAELLSWLEDTGGYCDCEVAANSYDHFLQNKENA